MVQRAAVVKYCCLCPYTATTYLLSLAKLDNDVIKVAESECSNLPSMFHSPSTAAAALAKAHL